MSKSSHPLLSAFSTKLTALGHIGQILKSIVFKTAPKNMYFELNYWAFCGDSSASYVCTRNEETKNETETRKETHGGKPKFLPSPLKRFLTVWGTKFHRIRLNAFGVEFCHFPLVKQYAWKRWVCISAQQCSSSLHWLLSVVNQMNLAGHASPATSQLLPCFAASLASSRESAKKISSWGGHGWLALYLADMSPPRPSTVN